MSSISEKLTYTQETKSLIKSAIIDKGGTVEDGATFRSYADSISNIPTSGLLEDLEVSANGYYTPSVGYSGFSSIDVAVPTSAGSIGIKPISGKLIKHDLIFIQKVE